MDKSVFPAVGHSLGGFYSSYAYPDTVEDFGQWLFDGNDGFKVCVKGDAEKIKLYNIGAMRIIEEEQLGFEDVLIRPARSDINSRKEVDLFRIFLKDGRHPFRCIPICCANMGGISNAVTAKIFTSNGLMCALEKHMTVAEIEKIHTSMSLEEWDRIAVSIGLDENLDCTLTELGARGIQVNIINIDVANGYMTRLQDRVREVRARFPSAWIIAGTVVTGDIVTDLLNCGADIIRCGIGQGQMCKTRLVTGVGRPQVSMLEDCTDAAHQIHGLTMSDGGCTCPGDVAKSLGLADFTMVGSLFAGADESSEEIVEMDGVKYKRFAGMSSAYAQDKYFGGFRNDYRSSEGRQVLVKSEGPLEDIIANILGGLRSAFAYCGCHNMRHWQKHCTFYKVRKQLTTTFEDAPTFSGKTSQN